MSTNDSDAASVLAPSEFLNRFGLNVEYFLVGRHHGFVPYFFPGVVALVAWAFSRERFQPWRVLTVGAVLVATLALLIVLPFTSKDLEERRYAVFRRAKHDMWQAISGGGEDSETPAQAAVF